MSKFNSLKKQLDRIEVTKKGSIELSDNLLLSLSESFLNALNIEKEIELLFNGKCNPVLENDTSISIADWSIKIRDLAISKGLRKEIVKEYRQGEFSLKVLNWLYKEPTKEFLIDVPIVETSKEIENFFLVGS